MVTKGAVGFQGPIGLSGVIDQSPEDGFAQPPTNATHPNGHNVVNPTSVDYANTINRAENNFNPVSAASQTFSNATGPAPAISNMATPWNQEGITPPKGTAPTDPQFGGISQEQVNAMQASQRAMAVLQAAPSLKTHPDIVAALAYNTSVPFTPETIKMIALIQRARSAIDYSAKFTIEDYNQTAHLVDPQAFAHESWGARIGRGLNMEGNMFNNLFPWLRPIEGAYSSVISTDVSDVAKVGHAVSVGAGASVKTRIEDLPDGITVKARPNGSLEYFDKNGKPLSSSEAAFIDLNIAGTTGTLTAAAGSPGKVIVNPSVVAKGVMNFVADQFDTPEHLYRYIATVQHKYGSGMAALALLPTVAGALVGTALGGIGGAKGAELGLAAEEALTNSLVNEGLSDLAAATLAKRDLSLLEERASVLIAQRAEKVGSATGQLGRIVTAPINIAAKVATSPISLGADVGFTGGGQVLFRQDYMDSRDGTTWAEKYPMLASTFGRYATQNMDDGGWKTILSGSLDAVAAIAVPDAIGSVGRVTGIARSAEGFTGGLLSGKYKDTGNWFGNVYDKYGGISRTPEGKLKVGGIYKTGLRLSNIDAAYNESKAARQTVNLIAQMGSAGAIMAIDARFAPIADLLAKARVLSADGTVNMTKSVENVKQVLRDSQTAAELMERPLAMSSIPLTANGIYQQIGEQVSKLNALTGHMFSPLPIYASQKTLRMENRVFDVGDRDALPAIRDMIGVQYGYGVADQIVNELANNLDPHFWQQTIVNGIAGEMAASIAKKIKKLNLPDPIATAILKDYDTIVPQKLRQVFNFGGPGNRGSYGYGVYVGEKKVGEPADLSRVQERIKKLVDDAGAEGPVDVGEELFGGNHNLTDVTKSLTEGTMAAAIVPEEIGKMHLPSYLEIDRIDKYFADMVQKRYEEAINVKPAIANLTVDIEKLNARLLAASDPDVIASIEKQITKKESLLAIKKEIGASVPEKLPNFGYGVFKKGLAGASNTYDFIDHYYNDMIFKRLALATGGWAMRTGMSEASLNIFRQGPLNYTAGRLAASVARHERAVLHIGKKFTREAAQDIAARIYYLAKEDGLLGPNGAVFKNKEEMEAAVANVRKVANEANYYFKISNEKIAKALRAEEKDSTRLLTANKTAAAYRGFMIGAKSQILKQLNKQDLLDAAIRLMYINDGHIVSPMLNATHAGIANDLQTGSDTADNINVASWRNPFITSNETLQKAKFSKDFQAIEAGPRYASALHTRSEWMLGSKIYAPTFAVYYDEYSKAKETLLAAGATAKEASSKAADIAAMKIRPKVEEWLDTRLTSGEKKALFRTTHPLPMETSVYASKGNPRYSGLSDEAHAALSDEEHAAIDHVSAVIYSAEGHVRFRNGTINEKLLHSMAYNEIPSDLGVFQKQMMSVDGTPIDLGMFNLIPGPELDYANYGAAEQFLNKYVGGATNKLHTKVLGPIVNRLTRDPIYIVDFAAERKLLNPKVEAGDLTRDQADVMAQSRASVNAMKYIHNPKNKLKFENMMRLWAPFYFAENQAWRRLGRLAWSNPGAAEQYTKAMYQTQETVYNYDQNSGNVGIPIPGSAWLNKKFFGVAMPFELSPNSLRTVFPWSAESGEAPGAGSLISSFLPKVGPIMSLPANFYLQKEAGMLPEVDKFLSKYVVGQTGLGQPLILSMIPNSILSNIVKMGIGYMAAGDKGELSQNLLGVTSSSYIAANIMVTTALLDAKQEEAWNRHKDDALPSDWAAAGATQHEYALYRMADDIEKQFKSPADRQAFLDAANTKTLEIFALKTALSASSPMSVMLGKANLEYSKEFQAEINATGSVLEAANSFLAKHPDLTAETLFTTKATGGGAGALGVAWPTSPGTADFMLKHKDDIINYPAAMRFALQEGKDTKGKKGYDQMAHFLQTSWGLRAQQTPTGFLNSYLETVFNQFHYGVLQPWGQELIKRGYSVNEVNNILLHNKTTWESRKNDPSKWSVLEQFGKQVAPLAFSNYIVGESSNNRADALQQLREVIAMPEMLAKYENFRDIANILMPAADQLIAYKEQAAKSGDTAWRDSLALQWNSELDRVAAAKPDLLPVIQQIFRPLAPIFTN